MSCESKQIHIIIHKTSISKDSMVQLCQVMAGGSIGFESFYMEIYILHVIRFTSFT